MTEVETNRETYGFRCGRCDYVWERVYEVRRRLDRSGDEGICYRADGVQAVAPGNARCPNCGGYRVRVLPVHARQDTGIGADQGELSCSVDAATAATAATTWYGWAVLSEVCHVPVQHHPH